MGKYFRPHIAATTHCSPCLVALAQTPNSNVPTFNTLIHMYNAGLDTCSAVLAGPDSFALNYPPYEFSAPDNGDFRGRLDGGTGVKIDWNDRGTLEELQRIVSKFKLPALNESAEPDPRAVDVGGRLVPELRYVFIGAAFHADLRRLI